MQRDIWVEFNDIDASGCVATYADMARPGVDLRVGSLVVAGDDEGNTALARVVARQRWRRVPRIILKLDLDTFRSDEADADSEKPHCHQGHSVI